MAPIKDIAASHGFEWVSSEEIAEVDGAAHLMRHTASGARLLWIENDDDNKAFSITFKTPAADDTGVFHILEHSVLCGSEKFPVKEPFVNLLKTSMQTFLNAMTFPDKTMYPVASTNEQDLENLMDVYLDAVFHPDIYRKPHIFQQEGWHLEVEGEGQNRHLSVNGVVYNEMKGALSDPDSVLYNALSAALFPDTTYRFESGGTPTSIPTLSYEAFLDNHRAHYQPDNAYIILYGNLNLGRFLGFINDNYLAPLAVEGVKSAPNKLALQKPVVNELTSTLMNTAPENACCAVGYVIGTASERERLVACDILLDALFGSNEAPLKRALLSAGVADDVVAFVADAVAQPFAVVALKGARAEAVSVLKDVLGREAARLCAGELDRELIAAALAHSEFVMREHDFIYPDGVMLAMSVMAGWLYDEDAATAYLRYEDIFADLKQKLEEGYFENLIRELFMENDHRAAVEVVATQSSGEVADELNAPDLSVIADSSDNFEAIDQAVCALRAAQEAPDDPEDVAKLPQLSRADIGEAPHEAPWTVEQVSSMPCIVHDIATHGIAYGYRYFSLDGVSFDDMPYATVLAFVLGKLATEKHSAAELDTLIQSHLGNLGFACEVHESAQNREALMPMLVAGASALSDQVPALAAITREVLTETDFSDTGRIRDVLTQWRLALEQSFASAGHSAAMARVASYYEPAAVLREKLGGIDFYRFLCDVLDHYEERAEKLSEKLCALAKSLFVDDNCTLSFAGTKEDLSALDKAGLSLGRGSQSFQLVIPAPQKRSEAFVIPTDVVYTARGFDFSLLGADYSGSWLVASRILSYDYLWNEVRVKGGAYGAGFKVVRSGNSRFYSYRDPRIDETFLRFAEAGSWLAGEFNPTEAELDGYVVSTVASLDAPVKPRALMRRQDGLYFAGLGLDARAQTRAQVLETTLDHLRVLAPLIDAIGTQEYLCVFGNGEIIENSSADLEVIDLLHEDLAL